jgi:hopene-associated glycosyltransferase HpnB
MRVHCALHNTPIFHKTQSNHGKFVVILAMRANPTYCRRMWALLILLAWIGLIFFWGRFWAADQRLSEAPQPEKWPSVVAIIPARDEADSIEAVVKAHNGNDYPGAFNLIVANDGSKDGTGEIARAAGAKVVDVPPLPEGWSGKLWAVNTGLKQAEQLAPDAEWVLLTDADILHRPGTQALLVAFAEAKGLDMVSLMARLDARGFWGGTLVPAFVFFFQKLYPFPWVNQPQHWCAAAAGGCILVQRKALTQIGGIPSFKDALIDDCALAARIKHGPPNCSIWLGLSNGEVTSLRDNRSLSSIWNMVARTAFTQLRNSLWLLLGSVFGMMFLYVGPVFAVGAGILTESAVTAGSGMLALSLMALAYRPTSRLYGQPWWALPGLLLAAPMYTLMTIDSAFRHWRGKGGNWKGRTYP